MTEESKAVATTTPESKVVAEIRARGAAEVARRKEMHEVAKTIEGITFGTVQGSSLTPQTRWQIAKYCEITGAEPMTQIDILGNKPYLNANYWADNLANQERFHHYEQKEIGEPAELTMRTKAQELLDLSEDLEGQEKARVRLRAFDLIEQADEMLIRRANWQPRASATSVVETTIHRFINQCNMAAVTAGKITDIEPWLVTVSECNWAGGKKGEGKGDPVGDAEASKTARTRSLRRCAAKAFSAWMAPYRDALDNAEKAIEAEFEVLTAEEVEEEGEQAVSFEAGEVEVVTSEVAEDLPMEGEEVMEPKKEEKVKKEAPPVEDFDRRDAQKAIFATLNENGIGAKERKAWSVEHGFDESTTKWSQEDFARAMGININPVRDAVLDAIEILGLDLLDLSLQELGQEEPKFLAHWKKLSDHLEVMMDGEGI